MDEERITVNKPQRARRGGRGKKIVVVGLVVLVVAALAAVVVLQYGRIQTLENPEATAAKVEEEAGALRDRVSKLMIVPDETPTVGNVDDAEKLKSQEFFRDAKNGDKVLMFTEARRVVIYRESENRVVNSGPIVVTGEAGAGAGVEPAE
jgi:hypothetical protein